MDERLERHSRPWHARPRPQPAGQLVLRVVARRHPERDACRHGPVRGHGEALGRDPVVEAAELTHLQAHRPGLHGDVRDGLAEVVHRVVAVGDLVVLVGRRLVER
ncbi:MAG: hypothetical protein ABI336_07485, partial [Humibacillus sp.]